MTTGRYEILGRTVSDPISTQTRSPSCITPSLPLPVAVYKSASQIQHRLTTRPPLPPAPDAVAESFSASLPGSEASTMELGRRDCRSVSFVPVDWADWAGSYVAQGLCRYTSTIRIIRVPSLK